jgi:hypothetical protein
MLTRNNEYKEQVLNVPKRSLLYYDTGKEFKRFKDIHVIHTGVIKWPILFRMLLIKVLTGKLIISHLSLLS